jgi:hypothetical protein
MGGGGGGLLSKADSPSCSNREESK